MTIHQTIAKETATPHCSGGANLKTINLALQGGGAHGAFTWGVLDRLLEEPALRRPLAGKRIALLGHPASTTRDLTHALDALGALPGIRLAAA
ncbi:MAG: hypothetical protein ACK4S3_05195, partial [Parvibaculum sp.]